VVEAPPPTRWRYPIALLLAVALVYYPAFHSQIYLGGKLDDFPLHIAYAMELQNTWHGLDLVVRAYMGWQHALYFWNRLFGLDFRLASLVSAVLCEIVLAVVVYRLFSPLVRANRLAAWKAAAITLGLMMAAPISVLWPVDHLMYLGYLGPTSYHNPSIVLLRPLAIVQFGLACTMLGGTRFSGWRIAGVAAISILTTFAKPNLAICLLPALGLLALARLARKQDLDLRGLVLGIFAPVVAVLAWQFVVAYIMDEKSGIAFMPLVVMRGYSDHLAIKFLASILFPAVLVLVYLRRALADVRMVLAWTTFALGAAYTYLLAETGKRLTHGNFGWCAEITLFILFVVSMVFYVEAPATSRWKAWAIQLAWGLHVAFGVAYYLNCLINRNFW